MECRRSDNERFAVMDSGPGTGAPSRNDREAEETDRCRSASLAPLPPLVDSHAAHATRAIRAPS